MGEFGTGVELNLKFGAYNGSLTIEDFTFTDVGSSTGNDPSGHLGGSAIAPQGPRRSRATAPTGQIRQIVTNFSVTVQNGTIDGTSTGIRLGEPGKANPDAQRHRHGRDRHQRRRRRATSTTASTATSTTSRTRRLTVNLSNGADELIAAEHRCVGRRHRGQWPRRRRHRSRPPRATTRSPAARTTTRSAARGAPTRRFMQPISPRATSRTTPSTTSGR